MSAYIARRIFLMIPTLLGILFVSFVVVQFAPGGPVERVIAQLSGADTGASSRISGSSGGDFGARGVSMLLLWRFYSVILLTILGAYLMVHSLGTRAARELVTIGWAMIQRLSIV